MQALRSAGWGLRKNPMESMDVNLKVITHLAAERTARCASIPNRGGRARCKVGAAPGTKAYHLNPQVSMLLYPAVRAAAQCGGAGCETVMMQEAGAAQSALGRNMLPVRLGSSDATTSRRTLPTLMEDLQAVMVRRDPRSEVCVVAVPVT